MNSLSIKSLSTVHITKRSVRVTRQTLNTLLFIHRFRHASARHLQLNLGHSSLSPTYRLLNLLCAKGYITKQSNTDKRRSQQVSSYYLTQEGLELLMIHFPEQTFRRVRSLKTDATMGQQQRERFLELADAYVHFKRHYNGHFEFFSAFDLVHIGYMPDFVPDGYVRTTIPGSGTKHYFIEIYGWGRSTQAQQRRLHGYIQFADSGIWKRVTGQPDPKLFIVTASQASRTRLHAQLSRDITQSLVSDFQAFTTLSYLLDGEVSSIWREISH